MDKNIKRFRQLIDNNKIYQNTKDRTIFNLSYGKETKNIKKLYININRMQLLYLFNHDILKDRGFNSFDYDIFKIQCLLHEVAHYKQFIKYSDNKTNVQKFLDRSKIMHNYDEKIADRYALRYYKKFIVLQEA